MFYNRGQFVKWDNHPLHYVSFNNGINDTFKISTENYF